MSTARKNPAARAPQRERGERRVAALLKAAAAVFADKGYAAATMTEIAARAKAPIGSLYQFFPNKEVLGAALMRRHLELAAAKLTDIETRAATLPAADLADALLHVFVDLKQERDAAVAMLDAQPSRHESGVAEFRATMLDGLARVLRARAPRLPPARAGAMAVAVLFQLKSAARVESHTPDARSAAAAMRELRAMLALYLAAAAQ